MIRNNALNWKLAPKFRRISSVAIFYIVFIAGCGGVNATAPTVRKINETVSQGAGIVFEMKAVTDFQWDRFFVFEPYTLRKTIHDIVGLDFLKDNEVPLSVDEACCLLVFMNEGGVVEYFTYQRSKGDFDMLAKKTNGFSPDESVFKVVSNYDGRWKRIVEVK